MEQNWEDASLRRLIDELPDLVCRFSPDGTLRYVNRAYATFHGTTPKAMVGRRFTDFVDDSVRPAIEAALDAMRATDPDQPVRRNTHQSLSAEGEGHWHEWTDRAFFDAEGTLLGFMSIGRDVTELLARQSAVEHDLLYDHLTGVLNRRGLLAELGDRLVRSDRPFLVGYVDIDDFKRVNDVDGHGVGDATLVAVAAALESLVAGSPAHAHGAGEGAVGRIGGDEFVVIMGHDPGRAPTATGVDACLDRALGALSPAVSVSCGWTVARPGDDADSVLRQADGDMYARKRNRRLSA
ncbi:GGDEF domain-containing protein [Euzebya sp.]|uniref:GGDEF domain-containing protein n=1 Tax=Euzebya sp. TaxID=1971409 RepID=UPI003512D23E